MTTDLPNISDLMIRKRQELMMSQEEFARLIGTSQSSVAEWELAERMPRARLIMSMAEQFGWSELTLDFWLACAGHYKFIRPGVVYIALARLFAYKAAFEGRDVVGINLHGPRKRPRERKVVNEPNDR